MGSDHVVAHGTGPGHPGRVPNLPGAGAPALECRGISKRFGPTVALDAVSLELGAGEIRALVGENGAGKSTLLNVLAGVHPPDEGSLSVGGSDVDWSQYSPPQARHLGISVVYQELSLLEDMSVVDNIFLGRELKRGPLIDRPEMRRRAVGLIERLRGNFSPETRVESLSVAQKQLVEIAKALSFRGRVLALDEPSAVLGGDELVHLFEVVRDLASEGVAIIYVSHRLDEVFSLCDRFTVLKDGKVVQSGSVDGLDERHLVSMMVGRDVADIFPARSGEPGSLAMQVRGLTVGDKIRDIDLDVHCGEILGIAGLMGSGRTTLAKTIFGAIPATSGSVVVGAARGPFTSPRDALAAGIAYVPEDRKAEGLALEQTVRWNASLLVLDSLRGRAALIEPAREISLVREMISDLDIRTSPTGSDPVDRLSGGNQQKVILGKWLGTGPRVLILDEPTRGIDVGTKEQIYGLLRELVQQGVAVVVISSELIEILGLCDRIVVLADGRVAGELPGDQATEETVMRLAVPAASAPGAAPGAEVMDGAASATPTRARRERLRRFAGSGGVVWSVVALMVIGAALVSGDFRSITNLSNLGRQLAVLSLVSLGQFVVVLTAGVDLSVGTTVRLSAISSAMIMAGLDGRLVYAIVVGVAIGAVIGLINGALVAWLEVPPFIATLGVFIVAQGVALTIAPTPKGRISPFLSYFYAWQLGPFFGSVLFVGVVWLGVWLMLTRTAWGRHIYAVGGDPRVASVSGVRTNRVLFSAYVVSGALAALAGLVTVAGAGVGDPNAGLGLEFESLAAVVIGGASLYGGRGTVVGALGGVVLLGILRNMFNLLGVSVWYQQLIKGAIILIAAAAYVQRRRSVRAER